MTKILHYLFVIVTLLLTNLQTSAFAAQQVKEIRFWHAPETTRLVVDLSDAAAYKVFSLKNPARLVIDLKDTQKPASSQIANENSKLIRGIRMAVREKNDLRIVVDLRHEMKMEHFALKPQKPYGHRIVVDLLVPDELIPEEDPVIAILQKRMYEQKIQQATINDKPSSDPKPPASLEAQRDVIVAIDAGHGGEDPGAIGKGKTQEKKVVLAISKELKAYLDQQSGITTLLTRKDDYFVPLADRVSIAKEKYKADFFVSIHADSAGRSSARGGSVYVLGKSGVNRTLSLYLQRQEKVGNELGSSKKDLSSLNKVLADLSLDGSMEHSKLAAADIINKMKQVSKMHSTSVKQNNFQVLRNPYMPALLVETGFISNPMDERLLQNRSHQAKLAKAIGSGIIDYFKKRPPPATYFSGLREQPIITHVVKKGDYLSTLAEKYKTSTEHIKQINQLKTNTIRIGQKLQVPQGPTQ